MTDERNARQDDEAPEPTAYPPSERAVRRYLNSGFRFLITVFLGVLVAGATFYLMRKIGY